MVVEHGIASEYENEVTRVEATGCGCRSWFCPRCSTAMGLKVRAALKAYMEATDWRPFMVTLTVNPEWFESAEEAYFFCRRLIGKFMEELRRLNGRGTCRPGGGGVRLRADHYVGLFEPHESGWPHWHILLDATFVDIEVLREAWNKLGRRHGKPGIGHVNFTDKRSDWTQEMAVNYVTKYLTKQPKEGWPDWILRGDRRVRRFSSSQGLRLMGGKPSQAEPKPAHDEACFCRECRGEPKTPLREPSGLCHAERIAKCGSTTVVCVVGERMKPDGEIVERRRYLATLADSLEAVATAFGALVEAGRAVLGDIDLDVIRALCDRKRLKAWRAEQKRRKRTLSSAPKVQRALPGADEFPRLWAGVGL